MQTDHPILPQGSERSAARFTDIVSADCPPSRRVATGMAPGTCGEFVQGVLDGQDFLVNCPINLFAYAQACETGEPGLHVQDRAGFSKVAGIAEAFETRFGIRLHHEIDVLSDIPRGKGMASSTADLSAAIRCLCESADLPVSAATFAAILTGIEPSDCVHFHGIAHVNHLTGQLFELMPAPRALRVLVVDCGGEVDTVAFDRARAHAVYARNESTVAQALALLKTGLRDHVPADIARGATLSATLSQQILPKPQFDDLLAMATRHGALGLNCAHSGTVLGVLYQPAGDTGVALAEAIGREFGRDLAIVGDFQIIEGGCYGRK